MKKLIILFMASMLFGMFAACGGGSGGATATAGTTQGVDTPAAISVVTAK